jgi:hypothetical protein
MLGVVREVLYFLRWLNGKMTSRGLRCFEGGLGDRFYRNPYGRKICGRTPTFEAMKKT